MSNVNPRRSPLAQPVPALQEMCLLYGILVARHLGVVGRARQWTCHARHTAIVSYQSLGRMYHSYRIAVCISSANRAIGDNAYLDKLLPKFREGY
jgi:hypothetical protein